MTYWNFAKTYVENLACKCKCDAQSDFVQCLNQHKGQSSNLLISILTGFLGSTSVLNADKMNKSNHDGKFLVWFCWHILCLSATKPSPFLKWKNGVSSLKAVLPYLVTDVKIVYIYSKVSKFKKLTVSHYSNTISKFTECKQCH